MAKNTFLSFSTTPGDNTDVGGIVILGSAAVSNFDNALRTFIAILRGDLDNGTVFVTRSTGYTAVAGDNNAFYEFTATATLALTAAATLAADWHMMVFANGGAVTVDPNSTELINGAATLTIANGDAAFIVCTGTAFKAIVIPTASAAKLGEVNAFTKTQKWAKGADVASATSLTLGTDGNYFDVTGTTTITSIATVGVGTVIKLHFDAALTLTHHSTDFILPDGTNITTAAGDEAEFVEYETGDWRCTNFTYANSSRAFNSTGAAPVYACRAWVNFNGTGTVAIRGGGNVSSITDFGTGNYQVNMAAALPDTNYSVNVTFDPDSDGVSAFAVTANPRTVHMQESLKATSSFRILCGALSAGGSATIDFRSLNVVVVR